MNDQPSSLPDLLNQPEGLATRLRAMLEASGMTGKAFAAASGLSQSKVSNFRLGQRVPSSDDIAKWANACGRGEEIKELQALADAVTAEHKSWKQQLRGGHAALQDKILAPLDETATRIRVFQPSTVPGPLQTAGYARAVFTEQIELRDLPGDDLEASVAKRLERQPLLYAPGKSWEFLLDEAVLVRDVFGPDVHLPQLDRLQSLIGLPNVHLGVVPFRHQSTVSPLHAFTLFDDVGVSEGFVDSGRYEGDAAVFLHKVFDRLWSRAVVGEDARPLLTRAAEQFRRRRDTGGEG